MDDESLFKPVDVARYSAAAAAVGIQIGAVAMCIGLLDVGMFKWLLMGLPWEGQFSDLWRGPFLMWGYRIVLLALMVFVPATIGWYVGSRFGSVDDFYWYDLHKNASRRAAEFTADPSNKVIVRLALDLEHERFGACRPDTIHRFVEAYREEGFEAGDTQYLRTLREELKQLLGRVDALIRTSQVPSMATMTHGGRTWTATELSEICDSVSDELRELMDELPESG